ncbi:MAG: hypothetical protein Q8K32_04190 [Archangium sp.]|nr:hypothetical protein [Archangium sp.]
MRVRNVSAAGAWKWLVVLVTVGTAAAGADLSVRVSPSHLQLGADPGAVIEVEGPSDLSRLQVTVSHGRVGPARQLSPGHFVVDYLPPDQTFPRVAIIAARATSASHPLHGWTTLPLWGSAEAAVKTGPHQQVSIQIGQRTFGPVQADAKGSAVIPVLIPPGIREAHFGRRVLNLGLPRTSLTLLVLEEPEQAGDRPPRLGVRLYAITEDGRPRGGLRLKARAGRGTVGEFSAVSEGVYVSQWTIPATPPGEVELSAWSTTEAEAVTTARLLVPGGPPASLALSVEPSEYTAGDPGEVKLSAEVRDANGFLTQGVPEFTTGLGRVGPLTEAGLGKWSARVQLPTELGGATAAPLRAHLAGAPDAEVSVRLKAGPAKSIRSSPERLAVVGDGSALVEVQLQLVDAWGNPTGGEVVATSGEGELTRLPGASPRYLYRSPRRSGATTLALVSGELRAELPVALTPAPAILTLAPRVGVLTNFGNVVAPLLGVEFMVWPGAHVGVGAEAGFFFLARRGQVAGADFAGSTAHLTVQAVPLLASTSWRSALGAVRLRATASGGVVLSAAQLALQDQPQVNELTAAPTARLAVSLGMQAGRGVLFLELAGGWAGALGTKTVTGPLVWLGSSVGYSFDVF